MPRAYQENAPLGAQDRAVLGERLKNLGNDLFRGGHYKDAESMYNEAVNANGTQPVYMSNLAATYLKLENYEMAEKAASLALVHDPRMAKARFRRGLARKESNRLKAATADFETILREDPGCAEAKVELAAVRRLYQNGANDDSDDSDDSIDYEFPAPDQPPCDPLPLWRLDESEGPSHEYVDHSEHVGNGIPCKHHNRKPLGCAKGARCAYSHAPDARSMPDSEGRNVCLYFLLGACKFEDRCIYSHSRENLPDLWGTELRRHEVKELITQNELAIQERRLFSKYMGKGPIASETLTAVHNALIESKKKKKKKEAQRADTLRAPCEILDDEPPPAPPTPFIMHLTLNKSTEIPLATVEGLRAHMDVSRAKSKAKALEMLASPLLLGVYITDAAITLDKNAGLLRQLAAYARAGGTVVLGGSFKLLVSNAQTDVPDARLAVFFRKGWGVEWGVGARREGRQTLAVNAKHRLAAAGGPVPNTYSIAGLRLKGVSMDDALYLPSGVDSASKLVETPVVFANLGKGHLGFVGDDGAERDTTDIIAAMLSFSP